MTYKEIQDFLIEVRKIKKLSQRELAELMGVSQALVSKLEAGATTPTLRMIHLWAGALGIKVTILLEEKSK